MEFPKLRGDLDLETRSYTEYHQSVGRWLHKLHETMVSLFNEIQVRCLPFPSRGVKMEEMFEWVGEEVKTMLDIVWQLNDYFIILVVEGVLNMLNNEGCQELGRLRELAASNDAAVLQDVLENV
jgi:hypothetical protein